MALGGTNRTGSPGHHAPDERAGDIDGALATARMIEDPWLHLIALAQIAQPLIAAGEHAALQAPIREALTTVKSLTDGGYPRAGGVLFVVAQVQLVAGDIAGARATARMPEAAPFQALTLPLIAWVQAKTGDRAGAEATLREVPTSPELTSPDKDAGLRFVALVQSSMGDVQAALATAERIEDPGKRVEALVDIAAGRSPFAE